MVPVPIFFMSMYSPPIWMIEETTNVEYKRANFFDIPIEPKLSPGACEAEASEGTSAAVTDNKD